MHRAFLILVLMLALVPFSHAATITGTTYDGLTLDVLKNVIVSVTTNPIQTKLTKDGTYSFEVAPGKYTIKATYLEEGTVVQEANQVLDVKGEGNYTVDLILLPDLGDIPDVPLPDDETPLSWWEQLVQGPLTWLILLGIVLVGIGYAVTQGKKNIHRAPDDLTTVEHKTNTQPLKDEDLIMDQYAWEVIDHLQRGGNRLTQKELRAMVNIGEAKVSLVVSELESYGIIKKIKKGRGNILVLTEKGREEWDKNKKKESPVPTPVPDEPTSLSDLSE